METPADLEEKLLGLPVADRGRIVVAVRESVVENPAALSDERIDPDGIRMAEGRDAEIESGKSKTIGHKEFRRLMGGDE